MIIKFNNRNKFVLYVISKAIKIDLKNFNQTLNLLKQKGILNTGLKIIKSGRFAFIPVIDIINGYEIYEINFEEYKKVKDYKDLIDIPENMKKLLPTSYDRIGEVILIKLPEELYPYAEIIGNALLKFHKNMKTVAIDLGVKGELRVRQLRVISGNGLFTIHKENGIRIAVNPADVYFSPRLSGERKRVMEKVFNGEIIIDMFCGAGPFSVLIGKSKNVDIYAIDKNPNAIEYLKMSIKLNRINNIKPLLGDVMDVMERLPFADRIIMDLPFYSFNFIDFALRRSKKGTIIHLYTITDECSSMLKSLENRFFILEHGVVHGYSPKENMYFFDLEVK